MNTITTTRDFPQITRTARTGRYVRERTRRPYFDLHEFLGWALLAAIAIAAGLTTLAFIGITGTWQAAVLTVVGLSPIVMIAGLISRYAGFDPQDA